MNLYALITATSLQHPTNWVIPVSTTTDGQDQSEIGAESGNKPSKKLKPERNKTMKNNKFAKISLIILTAVLCIGAAFAMNISATDSAPTPVISSKNIEYNTQFSLMYAVPANTVTSGASVTLYVHETEPASESAYAGGVAYTVSTVSPKGDPSRVEGAVGLDYDAYVFKTDGITAKAFGTEFYVVAKDNTSGKFSKVVRYSVAEYLYERLATPGISNDQKLMYEGAIDFATGVQLTVGTDHLNATVDADKLIKNLRYVVVEGGTVAGFSTGLYPVGSTVQPSAEGISNWNIEVVGVKGEQISSATKVSSFVVPETEGAVKIRFTQGSVFAYRSGINTFSSYTVEDEVSAISDIINVTSSASGEFATDAERGTCLKLTPNSAAAAAQLFNHGSTVTADEATAYEVSFDLKITPVYTRNNTTIQFRLLEGSTNIHRITIYGTSQKEDTLILAPDGNSSANVNFKTEEGIVATEWIHFRAVVYKNDPSIYIYINGNTETYMVSSVLRASSTYDGADLSTLSATLQADSNGLATDFYIDNYFCGYTTDKKPAQ